MRYAVLVKHFARDLWDIRIEIINVPSDVIDFGPKEAEAQVRQSLLGPFEVIAVVDRIAERDALMPAPKQESGD